MKAWFKKLPLPTCLLVLGLASLGSLLGSYHMGTRSLLGGLAGILLLLLMVKILLFPESLREGFRDPVTASALASFPLSIMFLSTYVQPVMPTAAYTAWQLSIGLSVLFMVLSIRTVLHHFSILKVFPSVFVLYLGIVTAGVTAPVYGMEPLGQLVFWFGLLIFLPLLLLVTYRVLKFREIPEAARPTLIFYAAPASLLLAGYLASFPVKDHALLLPLGILTLLLALYGLVQMARLLVLLPFQSSFSAFTFPFVFSAIALSALVEYLAGEGYVSSWFGPVRIVTVLGATLIVLFVFFQYVWFMTTPEKAATLTETEAMVPEESLDASGNEHALSGRKMAAEQAPHALTGDLPAPEKEKDISDKEKAV